MEQQGSVQWQEAQWQQQQQQQQAQQPHDFGFPLPLPPANPDREKLFRLSDEERHWALEIKAAVEESPDLENLSDLQYVQFAISGGGGNLERSLELLRGLQAFREEYRIHDTLEEGMAMITDFTQKNPDGLLSVAYDEEKENYGLIYDRTRLFNLLAKDDWRPHLGAVFYLFNCFCPDPHSMRQGIFLIAECEGMQSSGNIVSITQKMWYHLLAHYPFKVGSAKFFHTNLVANVSYAMIKPFMSRSITEKIEMGCQFGVNLSSLYLLPTREIALQKLLHRVEDFLRRRYENQATFRLS